MKRNIPHIKQRYEIIGNAPLLNRAIEVAIEVAPTDLTVLITGESGSGKESFSKIIHTLSKYKHGKFMSINCGAIPEGTIDSELFGHEKGSFTGAEEQRKGYFEETNNGTIFLDEIGEMPMSTQARLLRILEQGEYLRVGSSKVHKTHVRVIAATNVNLKDAIYKKEFREDLYYRINTIPIYVPPLRERKDDIPLLFKKFAIEFTEKYKVGPVRLDDESTEELKNYRFPGNIRELKNLVNQISVLENNKKITKDILLKYLPKYEEKLPILINKVKQSDFANVEKEILMKAIFDIKRDIYELRKIVLELIRSNELTLENRDEKTKQLGLKLLEYNNLLYKNFNKEIPNTTIVKNIEDTDNLSIESKEKELVKRALIKHNHKRKLAAKELGISERTLYRKIKLHKLDD